MIDEPDKSELNYERYWSSRPLDVYRQEYRFCLEKASQEE